jgi:hypothetical protein
MSTGPRALSASAYTPVGHQNQSKRKPSRQYYCPETKAIIEELYAEDFEYFGYPLKSDSELLGDS